MPLRTLSSLAGEIACRPGLIPISIDPENEQVGWMDLGSYHCYDGFFRDALHCYRTMQPNAFTCLTDVRCLTTIDAGDTVSPSGFIFHAGRCGSTLLTKALARSRHNIVFGEAAPHNQIWLLPSLAERDRTELYRRLVLAMGRRRQPAYRAHIVKFTSHNVMQFGAIHAAFPATPAIFLFREPGLLLASWHRDPVPWLGQDLGAGLPWSTPEEAVEEFFRAALEAGSFGLRLVDYADLRPEILPAVLAEFGVEASAVDLSQMRSEFEWDSKSSRPRAFADRPKRDPVPVPQVLQELYLRLREQAWRPTAGG